MKTHEKIKVKCEFGISKKCRNEYIMEYRESIKIRNHNDGKICCIYCKNEKNNIGRNNPNCRYKFDDNLFEKIDSDEKAYICGFISGDGNSSVNRININIHQKDISILKEIRNFICKDLPISERPNNMVKLTINSKKINNDIAIHIKINAGNSKSHIIQLPEFSDDLKWSFIRGYFDADGCISSLRTSHGSPRVSFSSCSKLILEQILNLSNIKGSLSIDNKSGCNSLEFTGLNAIDFLGKMYDRKYNQNFRISRKWELYMDWCNWMPSLSGGGYKFKYGNEIIKIQRCEANAVIPNKNRISDSGFDLTAIGIHSTKGIVTLYKTGIKIKAPLGIAFQMVPRSSIIKTGYIMANSIGIIDQGYHGEILIPLIKLDKDSPDIELPCRIAQLVPIITIHRPIIECIFENDSSRGEGGFGSTGK